MTIQIGGVQLRQAAAAGRAALIDDAAKTLGLPAAQLTVADGVISGGGKKVSYAELIGGKSFSIKLDPGERVKEKDPKDYKLVGKPVARLDIPDKLDWQVHLHAGLPCARHVARTRGRCGRQRSVPSWRASMRVRSKTEPEIVKVVREGDFLGVVAANEWAAIRGACKLKATWSKAETLPDQPKLWDYVRATKVVRKR